MTLWRPPRTRDERAMRAIRSMQNGSIDGRIVSAYPVKSDIDEDDYEVYHEIDEDDGDTGDSGDDDSSIKPWTDYFTVSTPSTVHTFGLSKTPWVQEKMSDGTEGYASVHVYWNGVFQRDISYSLDSSVIIILDPDLKLRASDTITVKYFYDQETAGVVDPNMYRMHCWVHNHDTTDLNRPGYYILWKGVLDAPKVGSNIGTITTTAGRYYSMQSTGHWNSRFRLPAGQKIPLGDDVAGVTWRISYDPGADIYVYDLNAKGNDYGTIVCHKTCCGFQTGGHNCECHSEQLPRLVHEQNVGPFNPSFGPIGGQVFASGYTGIQVAKLVNAWSDDPVSTNGTWRGVNVYRQMPHREGGISYNAGCTYGPGANAEDTIYGKHSFEKATYNVKIGVTATVIKK